MAVRETAKLSGLNPETYLTDISWPHPHTIPTPLDELLPWTWKMNHEAHLAAFASTGVAPRGAGAGIAAGRVYSARHER